MENINLRNNDVLLGLTGKGKNRLGETRMMNCGEVAFIVEYNNCSDVIVQFKTTGELVKCEYGNFKRGRVKSHFTPSVYGVGVVGLEVVTDRDNQQLDSYSVWKDMLKRCYSSKFHQKRQSYKGCSVCDEWLYYPNFKKWYNENYYKIDNEIIELDKDILVKGNKVYSPNTCVFTPSNINSLFTKSNKTRGNLPIGVSYRKDCNKYEVSCRNGKIVHLGKFNSVDKAFNVYKDYKENLIKEIANKYKGRIPKKLYAAMINYQVEITD